MKALFVVTGLTFVGIGIWSVHADVDRLLAMTLQDPGGAFILDAVILVAGAFTIIGGLRARG